MKNSILVVGGLSLAGLAIYMYAKNKNNVLTIVSPEVSNELTQILSGGKLPDGTTASGTSSIAKNPIDTVQVTPPAPALDPNKVNSILSTIVWQVDNSIEANRLSKEVLGRVNAQPNYKTRSTHISTNKTIYDLTQKMFDLGYAPNGKGGVYKIVKTPANNTVADGISKSILQKINIIPNYKTKGTLTSLNKEIYDLSQKMFNLGYVPDGKGGSYKIV